MGALMIFADASAEKLKPMDLPVALLLLATGIIFLAQRKTQEAARQVRVEKGDLTAEQAKKNGKIFNWCGYGVTACGLFLVVMWATGN